MGAATFLAKLNKDAPGDLLSPYPLNLDGWMDGWMIFCWILTGGGRVMGICCSYSLTNMKQKKKKNDKLVSKVTPFDRMNGRKQLLFRCHC